MKRLSLKQIAAQVVKGEYSIQDFYQACEDRFVSIEAGEALLIRTREQMERDAAVMVKAPGKNGVRIDNWMV